MKRYHHIKWSVAIVSHPPDDYGQTLLHTMERGSNEYTHRHQ